MKTATTTHTIHPLLRERWSPRAFSAQSIAPETMATILEAALWAPSAMNEQPWRYAYALKENEAGFAQLVELLAPGNAAWAKKAAALVVCSTKMTYTLNNKPNVNAFHDAGMANQNLAIQALAEGVYVHFMEGFDKAKAASLLGLAEDMQPVCMIALGYLGEAESLDEPYLSRERAARTRKPMEDMLRWLK